MKEVHSELSRREREIMDILYARGEASVSEVRADMAEAPSYSAVRATLRVLKEKGHLKYRNKEGAYVYSPVTSRKQASQSALSRVLTTFFGGSVEQAVAAMIDMGPQSKLSEKERERLLTLIRKAESDQEQQ